MRALEMHNLTMAYGHRTLFAGLSATVQAGETLCITGANGAGKSTLLQIAAGLKRPDSGTVRYVGGAGQFGYASPEANVYAELTGAENIDFFARLRGLPPGQASALLPRVGLSVGRSKDLAGAYSSGMRQRLKLAISLLGAPKLLIWDEPTLALDAKGATQVADILDAHRAGGGLAIVATNDAGRSRTLGRPMPCCRVRVAAPWMRCAWAVFCKERAD